MSISLQKCAGKGPTDYWGRLLSESLTANEPRDQPVLRAIQGVNKGTTSSDELAGQIFDSEEFGKRFRHFRKAFDPAKLLNLASALCAIIRQRLGRNFQSGRVPGFSVLRGLMFNSDAVGCDPALLEGWALDELLKSLPAQIAFANEIYRCWLGGSHASPERIVPIREAVMAKLRASLEKQNFPSLCDCLNENYPYNLFHLFYTSKYNEKENGMAPLSDDADWAWLRPNLLMAARECPATLLPQIIIAVQHADTRDVENGDRYEYDLPRLAALFGEDKQEILTLIAEGFSINPAFDPAIVSRVKLAIEKARNP